MKRRHVHALAQRVYRKMLEDMDLLDSVYTEFHRYMPEDAQLLLQSQMAWILYVFQHRAAS